MDTPRPSPRTNRTRRVPHPVLIGHAASLSQALKNHLAELRDHKILRERAGGRAGGAKLLYMPLPQDALDSLLTELKASGIRAGIL